MPVTWPSPSKSWSFKKQRKVLRVVSSRLDMGDVLVRPRLPETMLHIEGVPGLRLNVGREAAQDVPDSL